jgi:hypothetical protein
VFGKRREAFQKLTVVIRKLCKDLHNYIAGIAGWMKLAVEDKTYFR